MCLHGYLLFTILYRLAIIVDIYIQLASFFVYIPVGHIQLIV